jgi:hypothetical protein
MVKVRVSYYDSVDFLWLDVHGEHWLSFQEHPIVHQYVGIVTVYEKRGAPNFLGGPKYLYFQILLQ